MKLTAHQYAKTLFETLQDTANQDHEKVLNNFIEALIANNDIKMFDEIEAEYEKMDKAKKGIKVAEVTSAQPLDKKSEKQIIEQLNQMIQGKVELKQKVDEKILGGVVIKLDDQLIDVSVKRSLEELKNNLAE